MSQNITDRLKGIVKAKLKTLAINQPHAYDVSAVFAPFTDERGEMTGFGHAWLVTVSIPNPIVDQVDIASSFPIRGVVPPDHVFERFAELLFEKCMADKEKVMNPPAPAPVEAKPPVVKGEVLEFKTEPPKPKVVRERESHFPSKPGSGDLSASS